MRYVLELGDCTAERAAQVGGKAIGLGSLIQAALPVPPGFAITTDAYRRSVQVGGVQEQITALLNTASAGGDDRAVSQRIIALFDDAMLDADVAAEIDEAYARLSGGADMAVAVRSSATAEDLPDASFAGQQDTYLWIQGPKAVRAHVVRCWASLFTARAIGYRARRGVPLDDLAMGVVVQQMVPADAAGVMMTLEPVGGDRSQIYIEAAYGLGEGVVRGDVGSDRFWVTKSSLTLSKQQIDPKQQAHRFDPARGEVCLTDVPADQQQQPALRDREVIALADLGRQIEQHFEAPMDIEWAIAGTGDQRDISLLQARPETVWSHKAAPDPGDRGEEWDPLHCTSAPQSHWTTSNLGEAMPGVLTPLSWTMWAAAVERAPREAAYQIGALTDAERRVAPHVNDRAIRIFFGRPAMEVEFFAQIGDRMPGTSGRETVRSVFGRVPEDMTFAPTRHRYPVVAVRFPYTFITTPKKLRAFAAGQDRWYQDRIAGVDRLDLDSARALLVEARDHLERALVIQTTGTLAVIQPVFNSLTKLAESVGFDDVNALTAMGGGAELTLVTDIWEASRGRLTLEEVQRRHGFHGPSEGELSSRVWRQNPAPLRRMIDEYAARDDAADPGRHARQHAAGRTHLEERFLASLPSAKRPIGRLLLRLGARRIPLRGVAKRSFLQAFDIGRAAACRIGQLQHAHGLLDAPDDAFYLTLDELTAACLPADTAAVIAARRARRAQYQLLVPLSEWTGQPTPEAAADTHHADGPGPDLITGIGVSSGIAEGTVRVLTSPDDEDIEPDEILVAPFTDPSWSSLMFISAGLVVDIGGALSHAAVVAREMEIPCIVNTRTGTTTLHTGDRVKINGTTGTIHVITRAGLS
jgi:phosphohistidine swiveling domain-containing protein